MVRIDPDDPPSSTGSPIPVGDDPSDVALGDDCVWAASEGDSTLTRIDR